LHFGFGFSPARTVRRGRERRNLLLSHSERPNDPTWLVAPALASGHQELGFTADLPADCLQATRFFQTSADAVTYAYPNSAYWYPERSGDVFISCFLKKLQGTGVTPFRFRDYTAGTQIGCRLNYSDLQPSYVTAVGTPLDIGMVDLGNGWARVWAKTSAIAGNECVVDFTPWAGSTADEQQLVTGVMLEWADPGQVEPSPYQRVEVA